MSRRRLREDDYEDEGRDGNYRKRQREDDSEDEGRNQKRRRMVSKKRETEEKLESLLTRIGEKSSVSLEDNLESLFEILQTDLLNFKDKILRKLCDCALTMPHKITIHSTIVGLLNSHDDNFGREFVDMITTSLNNSLQVCEFKTARNAIRFLADLVNCHVITTISFLNLLEKMTAVSLESNIPQVRSDWYIYAVLSTLPWVGEILNAQKGAELNKLLEAIETYVNNRNSTHQNLLKAWNSDTPHLQEEYLNCLWAQIYKLRNDNWQEQHILRPYLAFNEIITTALQHDLPLISLPPHYKECLYPYPHVVFRLFDYTDCPQHLPLPGSHSIERFLIEEDLNQIIQLHYPDRKECGAQLLLYTSKCKVSLDYMIIEVIFGGLFQLPTSEFIELTYGALLLTVCKMQPNTMPQVLAQATEILYERIDTFKTPCFDRFVNWLSFHLSNFWFCWTWQDWADSLNMNPEHPKPKFVKEVLLKCIRLSDLERILDVIPESMTCLLPSQTEPIYKYNKDGESFPGSVEAKQLNIFMNESMKEKKRGKMVTEDVLAIVKDLPIALKIDVFVQSLFNLNSNSISHASASMANYEYVFKSLADTEENQICILKSLFELWRCNQQVVTILVDKMLKIQIVNSFAIVKWIFSDEMNSEFTKSYVWEILHLTIREMDKNIKKLEKELIDANEKMIEPIERLDAAEISEKKLLLIIFERLIVILTGHFAKVFREEIECDSFWYQWTIGRLEDIFLTHDKQVFRYIDSLKALEFTDKTNSRILRVFKQFSHLRA